MTVHAFPVRRARRRRPQNGPGELVPLFPSGPDRLSQIAEATALLYLQVDDAGVSAILALVRGLAR